MNVEFWAHSVVVETFKFYLLFELFELKAAGIHGNIFVMPCPMPQRATWWNYHYPILFIGVRTMTGVSANYHLAEMTSGVFILVFSH